MMRFRKLVIAALVVLVMFAVACVGTKRPPAPVVARPPLTAPRVTPGELDATVLLGDTPAKAMRLGAGPMTIVAQGLGLDGERMGAFVEAPADQCLLAYARGSSSIEDLDVAAFDDEGSVVAVDEAPDPHPTLLLCPPHPLRMYVAAHVATGEGLVGVGVQFVPPDRAGEVGRALGARGGFAGGPRPADALPGLDDLVRIHREALGGTWEEFRRVAITLDARVPTLTTFPVDADQCVDAVLVPDEQVQLLEVEAVDAEGRSVARAREGGITRTITVCSPIAFAGSLVVRPHLGTGIAIVVLARARGSVARELAHRPETLWTLSSAPLANARADHDAALARAGYAGPTMATNGQLTMGRRTSIPIDLGTQPGTCTRFDVTAGAPLALIDAKVWDDKNNLVTTGDGAWGATLFACARGKGRLDLETRGRPGPFALAQRVERWKDPNFATHPLAAARMLSRAAEGPSHVLEGTATATRSVTLDSAKLVAWDETVAAGQCVQIAIGAEGEGTGLELRLFDGTTNAEIDRSHAAHDAGVRACAPSNGSRAVRAELRATSGKLDAIVGVRML